MRRLAFFTALAGTLIASSAARADGGSAWVASGALKPLEQRIAVAAGPDRTTVWTSLRLDASPGSVGVIVPAPAGASLDFSSDAWFEALEEATAVRVFPPSGVDPYCPGKNGSPNIFDVAGDTGHLGTSAPAWELLADEPAVEKWATTNGLVLTPSAIASLSALSGVRFLGVRIDTVGGTTLTPTVRVAMPGKPPALPLAITRAGVEDLLVTAWVLGEGQGDLNGSVHVDVPSSKIEWNAKKGISTYVDARADAISAVATDGLLLEASSHEALSESLSIANGTAAIDGVLATFFERAAAYGDAPADPSACISVAAAALGSNIPVATACARADLGVVDAPSACADGLQGLAPEKLRCGPKADDLAVALSGLTPATTWLTRETMIIPAGEIGLDWSLKFAQGASVLPIRHAGAVDLGDCNGGSGSSSSSSSSGSSGSGGGPGPHFGHSGDGSEDWTADSSPDVNVNIGCDCSGGAGSDGTDSTDSCSGDSSGDSSSSCSGDSSGDSSSGCDSGGDSSSGCDSSSSDSSGCDSGGGSSGCDSGGGSSGCDSGGGSGSCSGGGGGSDCSIGGKRRSPRASIILMSALAIVAPLRRRGRKSRKDKKAPEKK